MTQRAVLPSLTSLAAVVLFGCGPALSHEAIAIRGFQPPERCGQGPYEIVVEARGHRWGEGVELVALSPRNIEGQYDVRAGDEVVARGALPRRWVPSLTSTAGTYELREDAGPVDNARCLSLEAQRAVELGGGGEIVTPPPVVAVPQEPTSGGPTEAIHTPGLELRVIEWTAPHPLSAIELQQLGVGRIEVVREWWWPHDPERDPAPALAAGTPIRIRVWSDLPNDLEGATFVLVHWIAQPNVPEEEWIAHLRHEREQREREDAERHAEAERRNAEWQAHCNTHHEDEACWGPGGYHGAVERMQRAQADAPRIERERAEREARMEAERARRPEVAPPPPPPARPDGPPPAPRAELRPPQPSVHATWTPGYWHWHAARWVWIGGTWDVPEEDIVREQTVRAPEAPPPPQVEARPAAPAPGMVWIEGYWQWDGARFVWIAGRWDLPRGQGASWQPPTWRVGAGGAVFVPGRWELRIGR
ncbi:YXWGXW repeat-containing protein [Sandaracinus amylolyticus]|uniref:Lipoprotein n=1 Tax=Sandaracinus amylolyticus TaxID=927083 RepID=A0A0F6SDD3_9BACT|nr:YXWGXW repeat-containing protein [Sandaracinus amylolyticus]AKF03244.1 lipoprotein [Sandaracinus amylolyticus]